MNKRIRPVLKPRCRTCKRKKIKCDYVRPSCGSCARGRLPCEGYDDSFVFITQDRHAYSANTIDGVDRAALVRAATHHQQAWPLTLSTPGQAEFSRHMFFDKLQTHLLPSSPTDKYAGEMQWMEMLPRQRVQFKPLDTAINALAVMLCGRAHHDESLRIDAMKLYGQAIVEIGEYYSKRFEARFCWHAAVVTCMVLEYYEATENVGILSAPPTHLLGILSFIELAGPDIQDPKLRSTLASCRNALILRGIFRPEAATLPPPWCLQPWGHLMSDPMHKGLDILVHIPQFFLLSTSVSNNTSNAVDHAHLQNLHRYIDEKLDEFFSTELSSRSSPLYVVESIPPGESDLILATMGYDLRFTSEEACVFIMLYWVGKLLLFKGWEEANHSIEAAEDLQAQTEVNSILPVVYNLCFTIRSMVSKGHGITGYYRAKLPLWAVSQFFTRHNMPEHQEWCRGIVAQVASRNLGTARLERVIS